MIKEKIEIGSIVKSIAGRDKNMLYVVINVENSYVMVANGKTRKINLQKRKNIKHIYPIVFKTQLKSMILDKSVADLDIIKIIKNLKNN